MKIAVNASTLRGLGSANVGRQVLAGLLEVGRDHEFDLWIPREWDALGDLARNNANVHRVRSGGAAKFAVENLAIRTSLRRWSADRLLSLGDTSVPHCPVPHLLLVQMAYLAYAPDALDFPLPPPFRAKIALMEAYFRACLPSLAAITVQTHHMKQHLAQRWRFPEERVFVVPSVVELPEDVSASSPASPAAEAPFVFFPASAGVHKNHGVLADMLAVLRRSNADVRCCVTARAEDVPALVERARAARVDNLLDFVGTVASAETWRLLRSAAAVVLPSKLESFGLPYFEAMAVGAPIVAADREHAREACGDAALYADADSGEAFAAGVLRIRESATLAAALAVKGRARFAAVSVRPGDVAGEYLRILESLG